MWQYDLHILEKECHCLYTTSDRNFQYFQRRTICVIRFLRKQESHCGISFILMENCILSILIILIPVLSLYSYPACIRVCSGKAFKKSSGFQNDFHDKIIILSFFPLVAQVDVCSKKIYIKNEISELHSQIVWTYSVVLPVKSEKFLGTLLKKQAVLPDTGLYP